MFSLLSLNGRKIDMSVCFTEQNHFAQLGTVNLTRETLPGGAGPYVEASTRVQPTRLLAVLVES